MEKIGEDLQSEKTKSQTAIRCARAVILLSELKNAAKTLSIDVQGFEKLMMDLAEEKEKLKKLRHFIVISLIFYITAVLIFSIFPKANTHLGVAPT